MKINKILLILILIFIVGCKKSTPDIAKNNVKRDSIEIQNKTKNLSAKSDKFNYKSIVISCGSGCAISYSPKSITQQNSKIKVEFKVEMYEDEEVTDTYNETYFFYYDNSNKVKTIEKEGEKGNFLDTQSTDTQQSFIEFGNSLSQKNSENFPKDKQHTDSSINENFEVCHLPFDFDNYYDICYDDDEKCKQRYPSYTSSEANNILSNFAIHEKPSKIFMLPPKNNLQPIIIAYTDSDVEGYFLYIAKKGKVVSSKQIAEMDGNTIEDFIITKQYDIQLYTRKNRTEKRILKQNFKIQPEGFIK